MTTYLNSFTNQTIRCALEHGDDLELEGFCHTIRVNKKMTFVVLRKGVETIQLIVFKNENPEVFDLINSLTVESTIRVVGQAVNAQVKTCTTTDYEIKIKTVKILNRAKELPFTLDDANDTFCTDLSEQDDRKETQRCKVGQSVRLDNRWLDLRTPINQNIFRLRSSLEACIRNQLVDDDFVEIHTPKIIPAVSEGGSNVFGVDYFGKKLYLAQSPQLYKQMMINAGFDKVFEIGEIFRAENTNTYRHLCEFTGLDIEFTIKDEDTHIRIIEVIWSILYKSFKMFEKKNADMIRYVLEKTGEQMMIFPEEPIMVDFKQGVELLNKKGIAQDPLDDIGTVNEKILGSIVKKIYGSDVYVLVNFPKSVRPFYTYVSPNDDNKEYSRSFDFMMRGNEIASGAQRVHEPEKLKEAILNRGIRIDEASGLKDYVKSFETGSLPHGGCGIGLERLIMLYLGLKNIRTTSLFPRDPKRTTP
jgi:nondiscriminating aspartyl-tRNA synthetase